MGLGVRVLRGLALSCVVLVGIVVGTGIAGVASSGVAAAQSANSIEVRGNRRVETSTVQSYFKPGPGGRMTAEQENEGLKALIATGLFEDVQTSHSGGRLVITVIENPVINRIAFEGNKKAKDEQLKAEIQSKPRGTLSRPAVQADVQRIIEIYHRSGRFDVRVDPKIIVLPNNRVDLVFEINEGQKTGVKLINFVGAHAYSNGRLRDVIKTSESNWLSFLQTTDIYDPDRVEADRDLLRRFYLKHGFADVRIVAAVGEYDPAKKGFVVTFTIDEGAQYRIGTVDVVSNVRAINPASLRGSLKLGAGNVYNADLVERSVEAMTIEAAKHGYAFANVRPRGDRDFQRKVINITFVVEEGTRAYIERINIRGNTRTRDYVIRREFDIGEGDAYNRALIDRAERRLKNLNYFKTVKITNEPGSAPDRVVVNVTVEEMSTGEFSIAGGYSTSDGFIAEASVADRNLMGKGQFAKASVSFGQYTRGFNLTFVEPYLLGYRMAGGIDIFARQSLATSYVSYNTETIGTNLRLGFALSEELSLQPHYSIYRQEITLPDQFNNCISGSTNLFGGVTPPAGYQFHQPGNVQWRPVTGRMLLRRRSLAPGPHGTRQRRGGDVLARLYGVLQHARQQQIPDQRPLCVAHAGLRGHRRQRELHPVDRGIAHLLRSAPGHRRRAALASRPFGRLGRPRSAHAGSLPDGPEPRARLRAGRHRPARPDAGDHQRRARRHHVLGRKRRSANAALLPAQGSRHQGRGLRRRRLAVEL